MWLTVPHSSLKKVNAGTQVRQELGERRCCGGHEGLWLSGCSPWLAQITFLQNHSKGGPTHKELGPSPFYHHLIKCSTGLPIARSYTVDFLVPGNH
jgi:hypothetical protein